MNHYPWQQTNWQRLQKAKQQNSLPHAMLLTGPAGIGKLDFAKAATALLLCEKGNDQACGNCQACHWLTAESHPDFFLLRPEEEGKAIKVDDIRSLVQKLTKTAYQTYQVVVIEPAENMNIAAANALLKTLEEPPGKVIFFLVSSAPNLLSATIRSRCQQIRCQAPDKAIVAEWLSQQLPNANNIEQLLVYADNMPLKALALAEENLFTEQQELFQLLIAVLLQQTSPLVAAEKLQKSEFSWVLLVLQRLLANSVRQQLAGENDLSIYAEQVAEIKQRFAPEQLFHFIDLVNELKNIVNRKIAINKQLQLESLFIKFN